MLFSKKIAFIGVGNMGEALLGGLLKANLTNPENIIATDVRQERLDQIAKKWDVATTLNSQEAVTFADVIVLCIKPQSIADVLTSIKDQVKGDQLVLSIVAGITTRTIDYYINKNNPVIRAMPNIPAVVDEGAAGICLGEHADEEHKEIALRILGAVGSVEIVNEQQMDVVTGLSGSGPAYIYMVIEALTDGGVMMGLPRDVATKLATQTVLGSAKLVKETGVHPAMLRDQVTTPCGTTIRAIQSLEENGLRPMLIKAVEIATSRSRELSHFLELQNTKENSK